MKNKETVYMSVSLFFAYNVSEVNMVDGFILLLKGNKIFKTKKMFAQFLIFANKC